MIPDVGVLSHLACYFLPSALEFVPSLVIFLSQFYCDCRSITFVTWTILIYFGVSIHPFPLPHSNMLENIQILTANSVGVAVSLSESVNGNMNCYKP
jgi:hypothetical protein